MCFTRFFTIFQQTDQANNQLFRNFIEEIRSISIQRDTNSVFILNVFLLDATGTMLQCHFYLWQLAVFDHLTVISKLIGNYLFY